MLAGRYLRQAQARRKLRRIRETLGAGGRVIVSTCTRATQYGPKHADWFTCDGQSVYVRAGKSRVCIDWCNLRFGLPAGS